MTTFKVHRNIAETARMLDEAAEGSIIRGHIGTGLRAQRVEFIKLADGTWEDNVTGGRTAAENMIRWMLDRGREYTLSA